MAVSNPIQKCDTGNWSSRLPCGADNGESGVDDIELTKMIWYKQIKLNTSSRVEGTQMPSKPLTPPVLAQNLMDTPGRIPRANEAWADIVA